tara:strand:- start:698 stop:1648 length:951 start_codon:yes stop_codon:yes gene_type:complete
MKKINLDSQFLLVKFPIIFPLIYGFILFQFPNFETELIILTILLLAETHFGATWPFFINKVNSNYIKENRVALITIPIIIVALSLFGFFLVNKFFLLIFFAANMFHVTRQSFGVCKLYCRKLEENKFQELWVYLINLVFFVIGFFRFYFPIINESNFLLTNVIVAVFLLILCIYYLIKFKFSENFLTFLTGCLIFYPMCFVGNPVHAIIMGVTMHYTQYIYLTYNVYNLRKKNSNENNYSDYSYKLINYFSVIAVYAVIMTIFSLFGKADASYLKQLIIIPIIGQMLHFYLDSQLWKFSEKYNRDNTLSYLARFIK